MGKPAKEREARWERERDKRERREAKSEAHFL